MPITCSLSSPISFSKCSLIPTLWSVWRRELGCFEELPWLMPHEWVWRWSMFLLWPPCPRNGHVSGQSAFCTFFGPEQTSCLRECSPGLSRANRTVYYLVDLVYFKNHPIFFMVALDFEMDFPVENRLDRMSATNAQSLLDFLLSQCWFSCAAIIRLTYMSSLLL